MSEAFQWLLLLLAGLGSLGTMGTATQVRSAPSVPAVIPSDPAPYYSVGRATYYSAGLMEHVAARRGLLLHGASGFSSYPDCARIGGQLMVSVQDPRTLIWSAWVRKRIVDCSQPADYQRHIAEGLVELSYSDAQLYGYASEGHTSIRYYLVP